MIVKKVAYLVPVSTEQAIEGFSMAEAMRRMMTATPEEHEEWARKALAQRAAERTAVGSAVELTLDALLDRLGFSREYAEHLMQPYCECGDGMDGWEVCSHARDLGIAR